MGRLDGKVAIISGAARGMGEATARLFASEGACVILGDVLDEAGAAVAESIGERARFVHLDVSNPDDWRNAVAAAEQFGRLNVLVNNAAILFAKSIADTTPEEYMKVVSVNQLGTFLGIKAVIEPMKRAGQGSIVNISSIDGLQAKNALVAYGSSKWAVRGMTKNAALELGPYNIRVNSVHPGGIWTAMHGAGEGTQPTEQDHAAYQNQALPRIGMPEEVARMSLFLASDEASYSTGSEFLVEGGWQAGMRLPYLPTS